MGRYITAKESINRRERILDSATYTSNHARYFRLAKWECKFTLMPKQCIISERLLWFKKAYCGTRTIDGPAGEPSLIIKQWLSKEEFMIMGLMNG